MELDLDAVAAGAASDAGGLDIALLGDFLPSVVDAVRSGRRLRRAELERYAERGAAAAQAGVAPRALIDLYMSASWRLWEVLPQVRDGSADRVRAAGLTVLRAADDGVAALVEGFQLARNDLARRQEAERREVLEALLAGGVRAASVLGRAADIGLLLPSPHAVLVARPPEGSSVSAALLGQVERALTGRHGDASPLLSVRDELLVCVFAAPDAAAVGEVTGRVSGVLGPGWQAAVGRALVGAEGVRVSYEQARDTLDLAVRLELDSPVIDGSELAVYRVLLRDQDAIAELIATVLGPLAGARGGARPLLETLDAYYATGAVATETARRLHLSVRAVTYRLDRVRQLLGRDPTDPDARFTMQAAVLGARLLGWPDVPLALPTPGNVGASARPSADVVGRAPGGDPAGDASTP
ncbi:MAG: PucR family transcriptional regulator [Frankiales bacterium]|nr:PucR family transcriptional regulator [Frankiales bacterium]